jgi:hypothetical protein
MDVAEVTSERIDQVNAVLDVLQAELEGVAIGTVSAIRGVRVGTRALTDNLGRGSNGRGTAFSERDIDDSSTVGSRFAAGEYDLDDDEDEFLDDADLDFDDEARPA